jgi:hypothetical protein
MLQCTMRVSISVFPPAPKLSSLELKSYLPALTILNVVYLLKDESYLLKVHYNIQVCLVLMAHLRFVQQFQSVFKICAGLSSCPPLPRWLT